MIRLGIDNPNSQEGIDICLTCELSHCELDERTSAGVVAIRKQQVRQLHYEGGLGIEEIVKELGISRRTVLRYLK